MIKIRTESLEDIPQVRALNELAFEQPAEARIVDRLRQYCAEHLSLVAEESGKIVGHILFTPVVIEGADQTAKGMGLAPMAVIPDRQKQGIGSSLVNKGLDILRKRGCPFVIVLGHPAYYPRFGFEPASEYRLSCQWEGVPDEAFMVLPLSTSALEGVSGIVRYRGEFDQAM